jgi:hypothetical protein
VARHDAAQRAGHRRWRSPGRRRRHGDGPGAAPRRSRCETRPAVPSGDTGCAICAGAART